MKEEKYINLILADLNSEINPTDRQALQVWLEENADHQKKYEEIQKIWMWSDEQEPVLIDVNMADEWSRFKQRIQPEDKGNVKPIWKKKIFSIAASILFILAAFGLYHTLNSGSDWTKAVAGNEKMKVNLPDNSVVWLNKGSEISYLKSFEDRVIQLKGEAYFEVQKKNGTTFTIEAGQTKTQVLGTTFNVKAYDQEAFVEVVVFSGKVSFNGVDDAQEALLLEANEKGIYQKNNKQLNKKSNENPNVLAWQQNKLQFKGALLKQIIPEIELFYNIKIAVSNPAIMNCNFNGIFDKLSPDEVIEMLAFGLNLKTTKKVNQYELSGEGCE